MAISPRLAMRTLLNIAGLYNHVTRSLCSMMVRLRKGPIVTIIKMTGDAVATVLTQIRILDLLYVFLSFVV